MTPAALCTICSAFDFSEDHEIAHHYLLENREIDRAYFLLFHPYNLAKLILVIHNKNVCYTAENIDQPQYS